MIETLYRTSLYIKGKDVDTGKTVRRKVARDEDGNEYVMLGSYSIYYAHAYVRLDYFTRHHLRDWSYV